jgi:ribA/ribD-fused uncharacterized protein
VTAAPLAPIADRDSLLAAIRAGWRPTYLMFWGHKAPAGGPAAPAGKHCLSQWWGARFVVGDHSYMSAEHYMMAEKARLFGDEATLKRILAASNPAAAKRLGREVHSFDETAWAAARFAIVVAGNVAKFGQNPALAEFLRTTGERVLVEASPTDRIWGIGLAADHADAEHPERWRGLNLLGFALMETRRTLASSA